MKDDSILIDVGLSYDGLYVTVDNNTFWIDQEDFTDGQVLKELLNFLGYKNVEFSECF